MKTIRFTVRLGLILLLVGRLTAGAQTADLIFEDSFGTGDLWAWSRSVGGTPVVGDCPSEYAFEGTEFYVDPATGDDVSGDGSALKPWASIQYVVSSEVDCTDKDGNPRNPGAPVKGGDAIVLVGAGGHDPHLEITGCYNSAWVTLRAQTALEPQVTSVHFRGSGFWRLDGLSFVNDQAGIMVRVEDHGTQGPAENLQIVNSRFTSGDLPTIQDWFDHVSDGMRLYSDEGPVVARCNEMSQVAMGFVAGGSHIDIIGNRVEYFSRDGIATGGHFNRFIGNHIFDAVSLGDGHHDDFFQSHMGANPDVSSDVEITGNVFMNRYTSGQPPGTWGPTQCLSGFEDGPKNRLRITNNLCKADHWHGITWYDTNNSVVVNNTAVGGSDYPGLPAGSDSWPTRTWISIEGTGNVVRNNITTRNLSGGDHNHEVLPDSVDDYFVNWLGLDLRLAPASPAIDAGNPDGATTHDILGSPRDGQPDVGAFEYIDE
ncbi:MAG: choice-of-anchor Q domain-containing protein [Thermoanaerobaculia bacterium]